MVVSCDRPPRYKKMSLLWRQAVSVLVDSSSFIMSWMVGEWWGATSLAENTLSRCPYRPSSGRTRSFHRGLGPSSELLLSEDNQHCFKQALNSEEKGATDCSLVGEISVGSQPEQPAIEMRQVSSASGHMAQPNMFGMINGIPPCSSPSSSFCSVCLQPRLSQPWTDALQTS